MSAFMTKLFGVSWVTSLIGFIGGVVYYLQQAGPSLPNTGAEWGHMLVSAAIFSLGLAAKDRNVTNSVNSGPAKPVS